MARYYGHDNSRIETLVTEAGTATIENITPKMTELAIQIIQEQWKLRNDRDPVVRHRARSLIKAHVYLLRGWQFDQAA